MNEGDADGRDDAWARRRAAPIATEPPRMVTDSDESRRAAAARARVSSSDGGPAPTPKAGEHPAHPGRRPSRAGRRAGSVPTFSGRRSRDRRGRWRAMSGARTRWPSDVAEPVAEVAPGGAGPRGPRRRPGAVPAAYGRSAAARTRRSAAPASVKAAAAPPSATREAAERAPTHVGEADGETPHALHAGELAACGDTGREGAHGGHEDGVDDAEDEGEQRPAATARGW